MFSLSPSLSPHLSLTLCLPLPLPPFLSLLPPLSLPLPVSRPPSLSPSLCVSLTVKVLSPQTQNYWKQSCSRHWFNNTKLKSAWPPENDIELPRISCNLLNLGETQYRWMLKSASVDLGSRVKWRERRHFSGRASVDRTEEFFVRVFTAKLSFSTTFTISSAKLGSV